MQLDVEIFPEHALDAFGLILAQQTVVDEHAGKPVADGPVNERRGNAGIHATRQSENHPVFADRVANLLHRMLDERAHRPVPSTTADVVDEVGDDLFAVERMVNLGMELQTEEPIQRVGNRGVHCVLAPRRRKKTGWQFHDPIPMAHPNFLKTFHAGEQRGVGNNFHLGVAVLAFLALLDASPELMGHHLHPVADAEHGDAELPDAGVALRRFAYVHTGGPAAEDDPARFQRRERCRGCVVAQDLGEHLAFADAPGDDLCVLRAEVQNNDLFCHTLNHRGTEVTESRCSLRLCG